ncbi:MAG TPA: TlpA family protein disulfide reductase [Aurantimonas coralicida]|uniref:TlpA family protein disulfide reductase n=2 Tax=root TaxID=1 RepID=A0A9C9THV3_9HYPH|nr:TlpA family protein disulfide reductase [Aurantimonas coralicida]HEU01654.1 TlpA family protein disulfide reductase [Aurantimonas coralicida]
MTAISLGPLVFAGDRLAAILAIVAFLGIAAIVAGRIDPRIGNWSLVVVVVGFVAARLGHVAANWDSFAEAPLRIFAVQEGGFSWIAAIAAAALYTLYACRGAKLRAWSFGTLAIAFVIWNTAWQLTATTSAVAAPMTAFATLDGGEARLSDFEGKPVVLNLWASWCPPCRREMPMMAQMAKERGDAFFVFANQGEGADTVRRYLEQTGVEIDNVLLDQANSFARHYSVAGYPATLFLDKTGTLQTMHFGEISREILASTLSDIAQKDD